MVLFFLVVIIAVYLQERRHILQTSPGVNINDLTPCDCGVVLTGSPGRIHEAFEVMTRGKINKLIISGVYKDTQLHEIFPQLADFPDVKSEDIILEKISGSTYQNAVQSLVLVQNLKCKNIILITSQLHMYRAYRTFKANFPANIEISPYSIVNPNKDVSEFAIFFETIKSLFYFIAEFNFG